MTFNQETQHGREVIRVTSKVLLEMNGQQRDMGHEAFTAEVKRRVESQLGHGAEVPLETLSELTQFLMPGDVPED